MIKVGIVGGTGYMGGEALRVLLEHPETEVAWVTSRSGGNIADYHPNLYESAVNLIHPDEATPCDVVFLALPTGAALETAVKFLNEGCKVIDLGAAFRLSNRANWEAVYGRTHPHYRSLGRYSHIFSADALLPGRHYRRQRHSGR